MTNNKFKEELPVCEICKLVNDIKLLDFEEAHDLIEEYTTKVCLEAIKDNKQKTHPNSVRFVLF